MAGKKIFGQGKILDWFDVLFAINSASVINIERLPNDIYYDERLIIDGCDIDFCLALKKRDLKILVDTSQYIIHGIGSREDGAGGGRQPIIRLTENTLGPKTG